MRSSCPNLGYGAPVTDQQIEMIRRAVVGESAAAGMDPRWIMAVMMQEVCLPSLSNFFFTLD